MAFSNAPVTDNDSMNDDEVNGSKETVEETSPTPASEGKRKQTNSSDTKIRKKTRSWVWAHFTRHEDSYDLCNCNYCKKELGCPTSSGTTNMKKHLLNCKQYLAWRDAHKGKTQNIITGNGGDMSLGKVAESVFREATNELLILGELPLVFTESLAWRHFCSKVLLYQPHSRRSATRDIVEIYMTRKGQMKQILGRNKQRLSLTTDIRKAPTTGASYMVITAHFIDANWEMKKMIIGFKDVSDHKGSTICNVLLECLAEWDIRRVFCITLDNASANTSAMKKFKERFKLVGDDAFVLKGKYLHLRCATHILNLVVQEGLQEIDDNVVAIRNGVTFVRSSTNRVKSFDLRVETRKLTRGSLPLDVKTRWNSTYLMLEQATKFRLAFDKMELEDKPYNDWFLEHVDGKKRVGPPSANDWEAVDMLVQFLIIFYNSTLILSASTSVTAHKIYNEIVTITRNIRAIGSDPETDLGLRNKAFTMLGKLDKYWNPFGEKVEMNKLLIVASVFDPRMKMKFAQLCFDDIYGKDSVEAIDLSTSVLDILESLFDEYTGSSLANRASTSSGWSHGSSSGSQSSSQSQEKVTGDVFEKRVLPGYERMDNLYEKLVQETIIQEESNELHVYLKEPVENPHLMAGSEYDVLSWWRRNSSRFPVLSLVARDILAMQVSSVASESAFSNSGRILIPFRSCLTHYMIEVLICTEQWLKSEIHINEKGVSTIEQLLSKIVLQDELMREFEPEFNLMN